MNIIEVIFWVLFAIIFYAYIGYGIVLFIAVKIKTLWHQTNEQHSQPPLDTAYEPDVTLMVAAHNEQDCILDKVHNTLKLDYPEKKLHIIIVTDGSTDATPNLVAGFDRITLLHNAQRAGKMAAVNRAMAYVKTPIVIFSDANAMLNRFAVRHIVRHYKNPLVGGVAGEKRILQQETDMAAGAGEGLYWRYESWLKTHDARLYSAVGAAGELFSIRTDLYRPVEPDTLLDDFMISMRIAAKGYRIAYEPEAYASEPPSSSIGDEMTRRIRMCAGAFQSMVRLWGLLNIIRHKSLSFQYISHRVLRWTLAPLALLCLLPLNGLLAIHDASYYPLVMAQICFYGAALAGWFLERRHLRHKLLFIPYYFLIINISLFRGFGRYIRGNQSVLWDRAQRAKT